MKKQTICSWKSKTIQVTMFANWTSLWWQRHWSSKYSLKTVKLTGSGRARQGLASHQRGSGGCHRAWAAGRDGPEVTKIFSDWRSLTDDWGNMSKEETRHRKIDTTDTDLQIKLPFLGFISCTWTEHLQIQLLLSSLCRYLCTTRRRLNNQLASHYYATLTISIAQQRWSEQVTKACYNNWRVPVQPSCIFPW